MSVGGTRATGSNAWCGGAACGQKSLVEYVRGPEVRDGASRTSPSVERCHQPARRVGGENERRREAERRRRRRRWMDGRETVRWGSRWDPRGFRIGSAPRELLVDGEIGTHQSTPRRRLPRPRPGVARDRGRRRRDPFDERRRRGRGRRRRAGAGARGGPGGDRRGTRGARRTRRRACRPRRSTGWSRPSMHKTYLYTQLADARHQPAIFERVVDSRRHHSQAPRRCP